MSTPGNQLKELREAAEIGVPALARASGVSERIIKRVEGLDGSPRLEIKSRLVAGLNTLLGQQRYQTEDVFAGWHAHRRDAKR